MDTILGLASHPRLFMVGIPPIRDMGRYSTTTCSSTTSSRPRPRAARSRLLRRHRPGARRTRRRVHRHAHQPGRHRHPRAAPTGSTSRAPAGPCRRDPPGHRAGLRPHLLAHRGTTTTTTKGAKHPATTTPTARHHHDDPPRHHAHPAPLMRRIPGPAHRGIMENQSAPRSVAPVMAEGTHETAIGRRVFLGVAARRGRRGRVRHADPGVVGAGRGTGARQGPDRAARAAPHRTVPHLHGHLEHSEPQPRRVQADRERPRGPRPSSPTTSSPRCRRRTW